MKEMSVDAAPKKQPLAILTPVCFALFPVLSLYAHNMSMVPFGDVVGPLGVAVTASVVLFIVLSVAFKNAARGASVASALVFLYFFYPHLETIIGPFDNDFDRTLYAVGYPIAGIGLVYLIFRLTKKPQINQIVSVLGVTLFVTSAVAVGQSWYQIRQDLIAAEKAAHVGFDPHKQPTVKPDIYYIVLDGYGRTDALEKYMKFSNRDFVKELELLGFYVATESRTNYPHTLLSLASTLNMEFFQTMMPDMDPKKYDNAPPERLVLKNKVARFLKQQGYEYVAINSSAFAHVDSKHADVLLPKVEAANTFQTVLGNDPASAAAREVQLKRYRKRVNQSVADLKTVTTPSEKPRFVFVHLMPPHPPFVFNADGTPREPDFKFEGLNEGPAFREKLGNRGVSAYQKGYAEGAKYAQSTVLDAVKRILKEAKTPPIIIIQGDHGSRSLMDHRQVSKTEIDECFPILNAYLVPPEVRAKLYPTITPINSFAIVLNELWDTRIPLKEDKSFFSGFHTPYDFTEVTDRLTDGPLVAQGASSSE